MPKKSAGILLFRLTNQFPEVLLVHPGGPFWKKKDEGSWSIPKGEMEDGEDALNAAKRELEEETGIKISGEMIELTQVKQSNKIVFAWAFQLDININDIRSNHFEMEWPPRSGKFQSFPEIDKAGWFSMEEAQIKIIKGQAPLIEELNIKLKA